MSSSRFFIALRDIPSSEIHVVLHIYRSGSALKLESIRRSSFETSILKNKQKRRQRTAAATDIQLWMHPVKDRSRNVYSSLIIQSVATPSRRLSTHVETLADSVHQRGHHKHVIGGRSCSRLCLT